jgi:hypothetical protein
MRTIWMLLTIAASSMSLSVEANAFTQCDAMFANADELRSFVFEAGVRYAPKKYFDAAQAIRIDIDQGSGKIVPVADFNSDGQPVIIYPAAFPPMLCRMVLATYLDLESDSQDPQPSAEAARTAAKCVLSGKPRELCLKNQARDLERLYRRKFSALPASQQQLAYRIAFDALRQIAKHEYAHHLLKHWDKVGSGTIARIDAEFEADFYAVLNGIQVGELPSAMYYFFQVGADMEAQSQPARSQDPGYESSACRATNINDITGLFGTTASDLVDFAAGQAKPGLDPKVELPKIARDLAARGAPTPSPSSCGRLSAVVLREAYAELTGLTALMAENAHLFAQRNETGAQDAPEAFALIQRLQEQARGFTHIKGLAARLLSIMVQGVGLAGSEAKLSPQLDAVIDSIAGDILSGDYGRLLKVRALRVLYQKEGSAAARIDQARPLFETAATLLPDLSEAWLNLAFFAFIRGDCRKAAELTDKAIRTLTYEKERSDLEGFRNRMRGISDPKRCAEQGAEFAEKFAH